MRRPSASNRISLAATSAVRSPSIDFRDMRWAAVLVLLLAAGTLVSEDQRVAALQGERDGLARQVQARTEQVAGVQGESAELAQLLKARTAQLDEALKVGDALVKRLDIATNTPTLTMWNIPYTFRRGQYDVLGLPDTFTARIQFTATQPVRARIMDLQQFARLIYTGSTDALTYPASTSLDVTFHDAEGCAVYVLVLDAANGTVITPNLTITRVAHPDRPTGFCAD